MKTIRHAIAPAVAAAFALAGCTAAAGASTAAVATSGSTSVTTAKLAPEPRLTHITAYSINTDDPVFTSVVSGPAIGDYGRAEQVSPGSSGASAHGSELELDLARGTFRLDVAGIDAKFTAGTSHEPIYPGSCSTFVSVSDNVPIVPGSGTGAYQGIAGTFAMTLALNEIHDNPCTSSLRILRQAIVLQGAGIITAR